MKHPSSVQYIYLIDKEAIIHDGDTERGFVFIDRVRGSDRTGTSLSHPRQVGFQSDQSNLLMQQKLKLLHAAAN